MSQAKVQEYYKQMNDLVTETYSEEDQQIIGCPSIQQVSTSTVSNDKSISHILCYTTSQQGQTTTLGHAWVNESIHGTYLTIGDADKKRVGMLQDEHNTC